MRSASSPRRSSRRMVRGCAAPAARCATTTRSSGMTPPEPASLAGRLSLLGKQSLVYGLGSVVSRFASLLLLPVYAAYLNPGDYGRVENLTALVAVAATISQLGMVNALFRFALERTGDAR